MYFYLIKIFFLADCRVLSMEILPISKYNTSPAIIYAYAKTTGISVGILFLKKILFLFILYLID